MYFNHTHSAPVARGGDEAPAQVALEQPGRRLGASAEQHPAEVVVDLEKVGRRSRCRRAATGCSRLTHRADDVRTGNTTQHNQPAINRTL